MQKLRSPYCVHIVVSLVLCLFSTHAFPQSKEKPKLKDFGSSLKRLKWDPARNASVETKSKDGESASPTEDDVVRVETTLVVSSVLILDQHGRPVHGLKQENFTVREDDKPQQVAMFSLGDNMTRSRSIVLIIDYSGSQFPFINMSITAAQNFVDKLGPLDRMALVTDDVALLQDFTSDKDKLKAKLESLRRRATDESFPPKPGQSRFGRSAQYSALMAALKEAFNREDDRPIIIFQTDGDEAIYLRNPIVVPSLSPDLPKDMRNKAEEGLRRLHKRIREEQREFSLGDVYAAAQKSRATIYTVVPGFRLIGLSFDEQVRQLHADLELGIRTYFRDPKSEMVKRVGKQWEKLTPDGYRHRISQVLPVQQALAVVATLTGGWAEFLEQPSQADEIYSRIYADISRRYLVGYYTTNKEHDGKRRKISIEVRDHPEYVVIGRKAYYAPEPIN